MGRVVENVQRKYSDEEIAHGRFVLDLLCDHGSAQGRGGIGRSPVNYVTLRPDRRVDEEHRGVFLPLD